jgi:hypothetical protein
MIIDKTLNTRTSNKVAGRQVNLLTYDMARNTGHALVVVVMVEKVLVMPPPPCCIAVGKIVVVRQEGVLLPLSYEDVLLSIIAE